MNNLIILVQGNAQFIADIIMGFTAMYDRNVVTSLAALMLLIGLLLNTVKYSLDSERNVHPLREFFVGCLFFMILVHPSTTPRFNVQIEPVGATHEAYIIEGVPFLASIPAWAATNLFGALTKEYQQNFGDVHGVSDGLQGAGVNPFEAVVHLHSIDPSGIDIAPGFNRTFNQYIANCYIEPSFIHNISVATAEEILKAPPHELLLAMEPSVSNWFSTTTFLNGLQRSGVACTEAFQSLSAIISNPVNQNTITQYFDNLGVNMNSAGMLGQVLGDLSSPTPGQLALGRWLSFKVAENIGGSQLEHAFGRGLFEAKQQRLYQRMGERSMFLQTAIPLITALEAFVFFIAPVMMILAVLGGMGLSYVGKYLMILVFTNLWSLIAVFVDTLTFQTVRDTINLGPAAAYSNDISTLLSLGTQGNLITEIEGALVVAASMTAAIPMLAMFMLYGGVHSLMGVMGKFGGNYDGKGASPDLTTQNGMDVSSAGVQLVTNPNGSVTPLHGASLDRTGTNIDFSESTGRQSSRAEDYINQQAQSRAKELLEATSEDLRKQADITSKDSHSTDEQLQKAESRRGAAGALEARSREKTVTSTQAAGVYAEMFAGSPMLTDIMMGAGAKTGMRMSTGLEWAMKRGDALTNSQQEEFATLFNSMDSESLAQVIASSESIGSGDGWSRTANAKDNYQDSVQSQERFSNQRTSSDGFSGGGSINGRDLERWSNNETYGAIGEQIRSNEDYQDRLAALGLMGEGKPFREDGSVDQLALSEYGGLGSVLSKLINDPNASADEISTNSSLAAMMLEETANNTSGAHGGSLQHAARGLRNLAAATKGAGLLSDREVVARSGQKVTLPSELGEVDNDIKEQETNLREVLGNATTAHSSKVGGYGKEGVGAEVTSAIGNIKDWLTQTPTSSGTMRSVQALMGSSINEEELTKEKGRGIQARTAGFMAMANGTKAATSVENGMHHLLTEGSADSFVANINKNSSDMASRRAFANMQVADNFLQTDEGREFYNSLGAEDRNVVAMNLATLDSGQADLARHKVEPIFRYNHLADASTSKSLVRTQALYDAFTDYMGEDLSIEDKALAFNAAAYFGGEGYDNNFANLEGANPNEYLSGGLTRATLQAIASENYGLIGETLENTNSRDSDGGKINNLGLTPKQQNIQGRNALMYFNSKQALSARGLPGEARRNPLVRETSEAPTIQAGAVDTAVNSTDGADGPPIVSQ